MTPEQTDILQLTTDGLSVDFVCIKRNKRLQEAKKNWCTNELCNGTYNTTANITLNQQPIIEGQTEAFFFENTEYQVLINGTQLTNAKLLLNNHLYDNITFANKYAFGTLNFYNQVGYTDITIEATTKEQTITIKLQTEVLSYKLNYKRDIQVLIKDIEQEYALLSLDYNKDTFNFFRTHPGIPNELIWWQLLLEIHKKLIEYAWKIVKRPRLKLNTTTTFTTAERLKTITPEIENEFLIHQSNPEYNYRTTTLTHSFNTPENQFLKHILIDILKKFNKIKVHALEVIGNNTPDERIEFIEKNLNKLCRNPFFRTIGTFKGFKQENFVLQKDTYYRNIFVCYKQLKSDYILQQGIHQIELKDISQLYEIWCFLKVKNITEECIGEGVTTRTKGTPISEQFVKQLIYGQPSEVQFIRTNNDKGNVRLATLTYNAMVKETKTFTTEQRPDITLRLDTQKNNGLMYTFLFDAKYRVEMNQQGIDVPPNEAINQMHRYRDAIYFEDKTTKQIAKEIIGGFILFPGNINQQQYNNYIYHTSINKIGIGAFPLKPNNKQDEELLKKQIKQWIKGDINLKKTTIPQHGLTYINDEELYVIIYHIDKSVNPKSQDIINGTATQFISGYTTTPTTDFKKLNRIAIEDGHRINGYYEITNIQITELGNQNKPIRIKYGLGEYHLLTIPKIYGINQLASKGVQMTIKEFEKLPSLTTLSPATDDE